MIKTLLFDVCGVLYDISGGVERMLGWLNGSVDERELMRMWISSEPVRQIELGRISMEEFARRVIDDFNLPVDVDLFIKEYDSWHKGPYEGAVELVRDVSKEYITASFSNISEFQWSKIGESGILQYMKYNFVSYEIGFAKPDKYAFTYVIENLHCDPTQIAFFDDNQVNVDAAKKMGILGYWTRGIGELKKTLASLGILRLKRERG